MLGLYTVNPALGAILPGQSQTITVDCLTGDKPGRYEEVGTLALLTSAMCSSPYCLSLLGLLETTRDY